MGAQTLYGAPAALTMSASRVAAESHTYGMDA